MVQRPLVYLWVAHYSNGLALSQFDPYEYKENSFKDIKQSNLIKFGLYPIQRQLAKELKDRDIDVVSIPFLPQYEINLDNNKRLIYYRDVFISQEEYHRCGKCKKEFQYGGSSPSIVSNTPSPICPHCGAHDIYVCKKCKKEYNRFEDATNFGMCDCGGHLKRLRLTSSQYSRERRWIDYYLGYQMLVNGTNHKFLMRIHENGNAEIL